MSNRIVDPFKLVEAIRQGKYQDEPKVIAFAREWYKYWMGVYPNLTKSDAATKHE
jgi:hypothetical protein